MLMCTKRDRVAKVRSDLMSVQDHIQAVCELMFEAKRPSKYRAWIDNRYPGQYSIADGRTGHTRRLECLPQGGCVVHDELTGQSSHHNPTSLLDRLCRTELPAPPGAKRNYLLAPPATSGEGLGSAELRA